MGREPEGTDGARRAPQDPAEAPAAAARVARGIQKGVALWSRGGLLRLLVSFALFALLIWKLDAAELLLRWRQIRWGPFLWAIALLEASNLLACVQWRTLLAAQGLRPRWSLIFSSFHVALFVSNFLPGHYGGDAVRVYDVYRTTGEGTKALAATFLDRFVGLITLCLLALAVAPTFLGSGERPALASLGVLTVILAIALTVLFSRRAARPFRFLLRPFDALGLAARVRAGYEAIYLYRHRWPELGKALVISVMVQAARVVMHYQTALAVDVRTDLRNFFLLIPLVAVFIALPISLNGIGVREGTGIVLFSRVGVDQQGAFGLLFLAYMAGVIVSLAGGVLFALRGRRAARAGNPPAWGEGPRGSSDAPTAGMPS